MDKYRYIYLMNEILIERKGIVLTKYLDENHVYTDTQHCKVT